MRDADCTRFLQWALPQLGMRWPGFRKVRRQVCKRIARRLNELGLETVEDYRRRLEVESAEWAVLDAACRITISRFYRDKHVFDVLGIAVLPALANRARIESRAVRIWSIGCASGEEVHTLAIIWSREVQPTIPSATVEIVGTDADPVMVDRAKRGCYAAGSLKEMPESWLSAAFCQRDREYCVADRYRRHVSILMQDIREQMPDGPFDLILCRNLAFTYFVPELQRAVLCKIRHRLQPSGYLVLGAHEALPAYDHGFLQIAACREIYHYGPSNKNG